jgi:hypothetical protein
VAGQNSVKQHQDGDYRGSTKGVAVVAPLPGNLFEKPLLAGNLFEKPLLAGNF